MIDLKLARQDTSCDIKICLLFAGGWFGSPAIIVWSVSKALVFFDFLPSFLAETSLTGRHTFDFRCSYIIDVPIIPTFLIIPIVAFNTIKSQIKKRRTSTRLNNKLTSK